MRFDNPGSAGRRVVLYIEDQPANVRLIQRLLERRPDLELLTAGSAAAGIDQARRAPPDLVLLDLHLPDLPGEDVLDGLRAHPPTADVPVVVLSADAQSERIEQALARGASEFLTKPLDLAVVLSTIDRHLGPPGAG